MPTNGRVRRALGAHLHEQAELLRRAEGAVGLVGMPARADIVNDRTVPLQRGGEGPEAWQALAVGILHEG